MLGASIGLMISLLLHAFDPAENKGATAVGVINSLIPLLNGLAVGFLVFSATGSTTSALMALSIAVSLSFMLQDIDWSSFKKAAVEKINAGAEAVSDALSIKVADDKVELNPIAGVASVVAEDTGHALNAIEENGGERSKWQALKDSFGHLYDNSGIIKDTIDDAVGFVKDVGNSIANSELGQSTARVFKKVSNWVGSVFDGTLFEAGGGIIPANGSLFWAGESGAEFVGNIGSSSAVANTGQMTDAIYKAAYMGMSKALKENGGNGMNGFEPATTDDLFIAMKKKATNYKRVTGNPAFN